MNTSGGAIFLPHSPGNVADVSAEVQLSLALRSRCILMYGDLDNFCCWCSSGRAYCWHVRFTCIQRCLLTGVS